MGSGEGGLRGVCVCEGGGGGCCHYFFAFRIAYYLGDNLRMRKHTTPKGNVWPIYLALVLIGEKVLH